LLGGHDLRDLLRAAERFYYIAMRAHDLLDVRVAVVRNVGGVPVLQGKQRKGAAVLRVQLTERWGNGIVKLRTKPNCILVVLVLKMAPRNLPGSERTVTLVGATSEKIERKRPKKRTKGHVAASDSLGETPGKTLRKSNVELKKM
jgi:hypothetical protein